MHALWMRSGEVSSALLVDMSRYFLRFEPPADGSDSYTKLLQALLVLGLVNRSAFASLNNECVLDIAAARLGFLLAYLTDTPPRGNVLIFKPHGAANLLPQINIYHLQVVIPGGQTGYYDGGIRALHPQEARQ